MSAHAVCATVMDRPVAYDQAHDLFVLSLGIIKKAFCVILFLGSTLSEPDTFLDQMLRNSNSDELLNSVLGRLEQNRPDLLAKQGVTEEEDCNEPAEVMVLTQFEICSKIGLSCVQLNKTIHYTRRRFSSDCWETKTMEIPAGCECMYLSHKVT
ncbi:uncharacterized protein LOC113225370 [Hyposmocoma kahamanoa]|uniref:uncharacterized protein LOC113225370 n=1 Tax=Hyposmocoma kahamanoa TaxID=1477025 RepID=UPI000E6D9F06|nr:uncharacterized protein LOC113225370 [Hyposmocoma kahamanoa]